ncbi:GNAT family N-acetyltransferase [Patescibacteria group bacterium]|nr:GNAT family N-acetyltransferase [Patescibacteria group bacterium]
MDTRVRKAKKEDLDRIIEISLNCFSQDNKDEQEAYRWVSATFAASPRVVYFVAEADGQVAGYINWMHIGGFRSGVVELDQIGVHSDFQGQGLGQVLLKESLKTVKKMSQEELGVPIRVVKVDTATTNAAKGFYEKHLGAKEEAVLKDFFYGEDEAIMLKRY